MVYNNPPIYKNDVTPDILASLADCDNVVCFKDSSGDTRRFTDTRNMVGDRFVLFAGLDDVVVESVMLGAAGWVSGMSNAFPQEGETLFRLARRPAVTQRRARSMNGSCRCCISMPAPISCSASSSASRSWGAAPTLTRPPRLALEPPRSGPQSRRSWQGAEGPSCPSRCRIEVRRLTRLSGGPWIFTLASPLITDRIVSNSE